MRPNIMFVDSTYNFAEIVTAEGYRMETCRLHHNRYVRIDDGKSYPQLCADTGRRGATLIFYDAPKLAEDCDARLFKTRSRFEATAAKLISDGLYT